MTDRISIPRPTGRGAALAVAVVAGLASASVAVAGPHGGPCGGRAGGGLDRIEHGVARAGLPAETQKAIYQRLDEARTEQRALRSSLADEHEKMRALLERDVTDADAVMAQADVVGNLETQMRKLELRTLVSLRNLVTPEQWEEIAPRPPRFGARSKDS